MKHPRPFEFIMLRADWRVPAPDDESPPQLMSSPPTHAADQPAPVPPVRNRPPEPSPRPPRPAKLRPRRRHPEEGSPLLFKRRRFHWGKAGRATCVRPPGPRRICETIPLHSRALTL